MNTLPTHWVRLRLPGLGRDICFVFYPGEGEAKPRAEVWHRMRAERDGRRPFLKNPGDPRWHKDEALVVGQTASVGGWSYGLKDDGTFWFQGSRARGDARAQPAEDAWCGTGLPACIAEVWP